MSADANRRDRRGLTALHVAAGLGDASEVESLLARPTTTCAMCRPDLR
jgi:ankyrin repeat protein